MSGQANVSGVAGWLRDAVTLAKRAVGISSANGTGDDVYDALNPKGRRRVATTGTNRPEDLLLNQSRRDQIDANATDVNRNFVLLQWMIRQTLNYCTLFDFHPTTKDDGLNRDLRTLMTRDCEPEQNDYVGRMSWNDMRRSAEAMKIISGDSHLMPLREGTLQLVDGRFVRNPRDLADGSWLGGAKLNGRNRITAWNFREHEMRNGGWSTNYTDRQVPASRVWQHIQYGEHGNIVRGVSGILAALNEMRDLYETTDLARAKVKMEQMFGIAVFRNKDDDTDLAPLVGPDGEEEDDSEATKEEHYDFGSGPVVMNRDVGEDVKLLSANSPGGNTIEFLRLCIQLVMLALDLPPNFYNPSETNFFGSQAAWTLFERSCFMRRESQLRLHERMTRWRQWRWILPTDMYGTGEIVLPRSMSIDDLTYKWTPRGVPFWKPTEQLAAGIGRVAAGLTTWQGLCDETGSGLYEQNLQNLRHELEKAKALGFNMTFNPSRLDVTFTDLLNPAKTANNNSNGKKNGAAA